MLDLAALPIQTLPQKRNTMPRKKRGRAHTRQVEYFRLWPGNGHDSGTWDTDFLCIPADTPDDQIEAAVRAAADRLNWRDGEAPVLVGLYCAATDEEDDDD